jgi:hypothetical protein
MTPQRTNGQVERANGMVLQGLNSHIFDQLKKSSAGLRNSQPSFGA